MNIWDTVTGNDMVREFNAYAIRVKKLPAEYQSVWNEIFTHIMQYSDFTGRNLMPILDGVLGLLEEASADGLSVKEVVGDDIKGFCAALAGAEGAKTYQDKWRRQLNDNVARKLGR